MLLARSEKTGRAVTDRLLKTEHHSSLLTVEPSRKRRRANRTLVHPVVKPRQMHRTHCQSPPPLRTYGACSPLVKLLTSQNGAFAGMSARSNPTVATLPSPNAAGRASIALSGPCVPTSLVGAGGSRYEALYGRRRFAKWSKCQNGRSSSEGRLSVTASASLEDLQTTRVSLTSHAPPQLH